MAGETSKALPSSLLVTPPKDQDEDMFESAGRRPRVNDTSEIAADDLLEVGEDDVPPPPASLAELDPALLEDEGDETDADRTAIGSLYSRMQQQEAEPTAHDSPVRDLPSTYEDDDDEHDKTLVGSLQGRMRQHAVPKEAAAEEIALDDIELEDADDDADATEIGRLPAFLESELTEKRKPFAQSESAQQSSLREPPPPRRIDPAAEPKVVVALDPPDAKELETQPRTDKVGQPRPSLVAEEKIEALLGRLEETPLAGERARIFKQIAVIFRDELGDDDQAFDALLEAISASPEDADTKAKLEELGRELGRIGEISAALGGSSGEFEALRSLEGRLRMQKKFGELEDVLTKEVAAAPDRDLKIEALLRHAELLEKQLVKPRGAIEKFENVIKLQSTNEPALDGVQRCLVALRAWDDLGKALEERLRVTAKASGKSKLLLELAEVHESKRSDVAAATEALLRAEKIDRKNKRVLYELARISEKKGDFPAAAAYRGELAELTGEIDKKAQIHAAIGAMLAEDDRDPTAAKIHFEKAVNLDPKLLSAWEAIQTFCERAGNWSRAAYALEMRAEHTDTPRVKALLYADLAEVRRDQLEDPQGALAAYERALEIDPKLERAARAVLDAYVARKEWKRAGPACELLVHAATRDGDADRAFSLFVLGAKIAEESGHPERAVLAALAAYELRPRSNEARSSLVEAMHAARAFPSELARAKKALGRIVADAAVLDPSQLVLVADVLAALGDKQTAASLLSQAAERDPRHAGALERLADAHVASGDWHEAANRKKALAASLDSAEDKYKLYVEAGEILAHRARDFEAADACYEEARKQKPQDHWILHTQLWLYGQMQAWSKMAKTLRAIAAIEKDPVVRAKGIFAMAQVVRDKCDDPRWAAELFGEVMQIDPSRLDAFERIARIWTELKDWEALEKSYRTMVERLRTSNDVGLKHAICHQLGLIYRDRLGDANRAIHAFQIALTIKPDSWKDRKILCELYIVTDDLAAAARTARQGLMIHPDQAEPMRELYEIYLRQDDIDRAWCAVDALSQQTSLDDEQKRFHDGHAPLPAREVPGTLNGAAWDTHLLHRELDRILTAIFARVTPAVIRAKLGPNASRSADEILGPSLESQPGDLAKFVVRAFYDAGEILGVAPPSLHLRPKMSTPFASAQWHRPAVLVSLELLAGLPRAALAFLAGKAIAQNRPEILARALFPSVSELKALAATGVRLGTLVDGGTIQNAGDNVLLSAMPHDAIHTLRSCARKLNEAGGTTLDVKRWAELAELSAARAGLLISGSTAAAKRANAVEGRSPADLPPRIWWAELALFATSDNYADLRQAIGIDLKQRREAGR